jgi:hypothetical protein
MTDWSLKDKKKMLGFSFKDLQIEVKEIKHKNAEKLAKK